MPRGCNSWLGSLQPRAVFTSTNIYKYFCANHYPLNNKFILHFFVKINCQVYTLDYLSSLHFRFKRSFYALKISKNKLNPAKELEEEVHIFTSSCSRYVSNVQLALLLVIRHLYSIVRKFNFLSNYLSSFLGLI
jgi:hypothetical protein